MAFSCVFFTGDITWISVKKENELIKALFSDLRVNMEVMQENFPDIWICNHPSFYRRKKCDSIDVYFHCYLATGKIYFAVPRLCATRIVPM